MRKYLDPEYKGSANVSLVSVFSNAKEIYSQVKQQASFLAKIWILCAIYQASLKDTNANDLDYKIALLLAAISLSSNFLITYSCIISLKYTMGHYKANNSKFRMCIDYLMLTCFGIITTVIPMQILDIFRFVLITLAAFASCCNKLAVEKVSSGFDAINQILTSLSVYQVESIKYSQGMSRLTYENVIWLVLQIALHTKWLDLPELRGDTKT